MEDIRANQTSFEGLRVDTHGWGYLLHMRKGACGFTMMVRVLQAVFGVAALISALTLWVLPGSSFGMDVLVMKSGVTAGLLVLAAVLWRNSREVHGQEVHIDLEGEEVRIVRRVGEDTRLMRRFGFAELGAMNVIEHALYLYSDEGDRIAVVDLDPAEEARLAA